MEFGTDTTRTIASLILSGTSQKYKDINWIWSHGGGALTAFAERFQVQVVNTPPYRGKITREIDGRRAQALLLRHRADLRRGDARGAEQARSGRRRSSTAPTSRTGRRPITPRASPRFFKGDDLKKVDRDNALRLVPRLKDA